MQCVKASIGEHMVTWLKWGWKMWSLAGQSRDFYKCYSGRKRRQILVDRACSLCHSYYSYCTVHYYYHAINGPQ